MSRAPLIALVLLCACGVSSTARAGGVRVATILRDQPVSQHGINLFATPLALCGGSVVVVSVEEGARSDRLQTVVRLGARDSGDSWRWQQATVDDRTLIDDYHTQPSVGIDKHSRIHVAYNMHNMPWQYVVAREPCRIDAFEFHGEAISDEQLRQVTQYNRTPFPGAGRGAIPGNQVTYPAFFNDRNGELYVTYRYAVRPARAWRDRAFAAAIARLDATTDEWLPVGGIVARRVGDVEEVQRALDTKPFAWQPGWTVYPPRLWFDARNAMHVTWTWREEQAGTDTTHPSYAMRPADSGTLQRADGASYTLPISLADAGRIAAAAVGERVYATTSVTTSLATPMVVLQPVSGERVLMEYDSSTQQWRSQGASPYGASSVLCDDDGTCWAYASGPRVLVRKHRTDPWRLVYEDRGYCDPKPLHDMRTGRHLLHVTRCDQRAITVLELDARPPRS